MWWLLLMESWVVRLGFFSFDICNKLLLNFCLKQIENNGPLINMIYKVLKNSAQGLLSSIHVRLLAAEMCSSHCFWKQQSMFTCFGFYRCLIVNSKAFCKILFFLSLFCFLFVCNIMADLSVISFYHVLKMIVSSSDSYV